MGIEPGAGFVEKNNLGIVHHGPRDGKALHHAAGKSTDHLIGALGEFEFFEQSVGEIVSGFGGDSEVSGMEGQDLAGGQREIEIRTLRHDADEALDRGLVGPDFVVADPGLAGGGVGSGGQNSDGGGFSGAVGTEQSEDFSRKNFEGESVEG